MRVEVTLEIELEGGIHEATIISSQEGVDAIVAALEGDAEEVVSVEVADEAEPEEETEEGT